MALRFLQSLCLVGPWLVAAQNVYNSMVVCGPNQCMRGYSSVVYGATVSAPVSPLPLHLLPGQYSASTNPQLLHNVLTSSAATLASSPGLPDAMSLPLDLSLKPGFVIFSDVFYSGQPSFSPLPDSPPTSNSSLPITLKSLALSKDIIAILASPLGHVVFWDAIPNVQQLPISLTDYSLVGIQSTACSPACSSVGICGPAGKCVCPDGYAGASCEDCASGHFGPTCQKCDDQCETCNDGISGTGSCLKKGEGKGNASVCDCGSGTCDANGGCQCTSGFVKADNGTQCAKCAQGFFETPSGDCKVCPVGCDLCDANSNGCLSCKPAYTQDTDDHTKCVPAEQKFSGFASTWIKCPSNSYPAPLPLTCNACDPGCRTCTGPSSKNCTSCADGLYMLDGACVQPDSDGICQGSKLVANTTKGACDSCGAKCLECKVPNFSTSAASDPECTSCVPGATLSNGKCVGDCPAGSFLSSQSPNNTTCQPCDSSCGTCSGSPTFCLSCSQPSQLLANGTCISQGSSCPAGTFMSSSPPACLSCHPDCAACSGAKFNECTSCPPSRPALTSGRCLPTCKKDEFWDSGGKSCRACDSSCGSCSGAEASDCLSCSSDRVLRSGSCKTASSICASNTTVVDGLGACLSELVTSSPPPASASASTAASTSTSTSTSTSKTAQMSESGQSRRLLPWWQILLMSLGCLFIFISCLWCLRRWMKRRREQRRFINPNAFSNVSYPGAAF